MRRVTLFLPTVKLVLLLNKVKPENFAYLCSAQIRTLESYMKISFLVLILRNG